MSNYLIAQINEITPTQCPCGFTRRAFVDSSGENQPSQLMQGGL